MPARLRPGGVPRQGVGRDWAHGQGNTGQDRGTRALEFRVVVVVVVVAVVVDVLSVVIGRHSSLWISGAYAWPIIAGLVVVAAQPGGDR